MWRAEPDVDRQEEFEREAKPRKEERACQTPAALTLQLAMREPSTSPYLSKAKSVISPCPLPLGELTEGKVA